MIDSFRLSTETENEPSFFKLFWDKNTKYRYGFELDDENIYSEWLYGKPGKENSVILLGKEKKLLNLIKLIFLGDKLKTLLFDEESEENEIFRNNSLFLSTLATLVCKTIKTIS